MTVDSIEQALSFLESEQDNLTPEQRERLAVMTSAGDDVRTEVSGTLKAQVARQLEGKGYEAVAAMGPTTSEEKPEPSAEQ